MKYQIQPPFYPIVYVRGYAMRSDEREETFYDTYYGFAATSVEKRQAPAPKYWEADMFEGQLIRFMKLRSYAYADAVNRGEGIPPSEPARSLWVCRFYDRDYFEDKVRSIEDHARELRDLVCKEIPERLRAADVDVGRDNANHKVILIAHSMGGLVCRTLIQNILPFEDKEDPKDWIHRFVTMGTPHRGIELSRIPDFLQRAIAQNLNPFDSNIFSEDRMRDYLKLDKDYAVHSLGDESAPHAFPVKRCFCLIGSDHESYGAVRYATGNHSDGLVKQSNAYVVSGSDPGKDNEYTDEHIAYYANVHRAHSGRRGIVNSYESFENIQRFLFGDIKIRISLENIEVQTPIEKGVDAFYDFEFLFSIRKSNAFLHRRQQDPCENALRFKREDLPKTLVLHTAFMNSGLKDDDEHYSHFSMRFRVLERKVKRGTFWDTDYPERQIYSEGLEVRVGNENAKEADTEVGYHWLSDVGEWQRAERYPNGTYRLQLRNAGAIKADLVVEALPWPNNDLTRDR
jgi:hypothetical protein